MEKLKIVMPNTLSNFELLEDEYLENGLIYCKKCKTPRICILEEDFKVRCLCSCQNEILEKEIAEKKKLERIEKFRELQKGSIIGDKYKKSNFSNIDIDRSKSFLQAMARSKKYCDIYEDCLKNGYGIYFYGACGVGKTHLMACMINELNKKNIPCILTNFFEISKMIRETYETGDSEILIFNKLTTIPFLFIDDLGTENVQSNGKDKWLQDVIYEIINMRDNNKMPTIFSSNLTFDELRQKKGLLEKTIERIFAMTKNAVITIIDDSYRRKKIKAELPF